VSALSPLPNFSLTRQNICARFMAASMFAFPAHYQLHIPPRPLLRLLHPPKPVGFATTSGICFSRNNSLSLRAALWRSSLPPRRFLVPTLPRGNPFPPVPGAYPNCFSLFFAKQLKYIVAASRPSAKQSPPNTRLRLLRNDWYLFFFVFRETYPARCHCEPAFGEAVSPGFSAFQRNHPPQRFNGSRLYVIYLKT
jgi:hypothetical protein